MKPIIIFLRIIYTIWAAVVFISLLLVTAPFFFLFTWIFRDKALGWNLFLCRFISATLFLLLGTPCRIHGKSVIDPNDSYVIIANHRSNYDAPLAAYSTYGNIRFLIKHELLKVPLLGSLFKRTAVSVDRSSHKSRKASMQLLNNYLANGDSIFLFPEGTRNKFGKDVLLPFKDGAFRLAIDLQVPVLPQVYTGTDYVMPYKPMLLRPGRINVYYLPPVPTKGLTQKDLPRLKEQVRLLIEEAYISKTSK